VTKRRETLTQRLAAVTHSAPTPAEPSRKIPVPGYLNGTAASPYASNAVTYSPQNTVRHHANTLSLSLTLTVTLTLTLILTHLHPHTPTLTLTLTLPHTHLVVGCLPYY